MLVSFGSLSIFLSTSLPNGSYLLLIWYQDFDWLQWFIEVVFFTCGRILYFVWIWCPTKESGPIQWWELRVEPLGSVRTGGGEQDGDGPVIVIVILLPLPLQHILLTCAPMDRVGPWTVIEFVVVGLFIIQMMKCIVSNRFRVLPMVFTQLCKSLVAWVDQAQLPFPDSTHSSSSQGLVFDTSVLGGYWFLKVTWWCFKHLKSILPHSRPVILGGI